MSRPERIGFSFFPDDTDIFTDRKIKKLLREYGGDGFTIYHSVKCEAYRDKGYYVIWDDDYLFDIADLFHMDEAKVKAIIEYCAEIDLFCKEKFGNGILTSRGIQKRWLTMTQTSKRKVKEILPEYLVNGVIEEKSGVSSEETKVSLEETVENSEESAQRKERKGKEVNERNLFPREKYFNEILELFYFKNYNQPWDVAETFFNHYEKTGWNDANGRPIKDIKAAARNWNNHTTKGKNSSDDILKNWQIAFHIIKSKSKDYHLFLYSGIIFRQADRFMVFKMSEHVRAQIEGNKPLVAAFNNAFGIAFSKNQKYTIETNKAIATA
ncbi:DUF4373 domain-containing protein [uncultured Draconibacterium sp.]|uniref:DUF4373 domain-containing protein n=1 Tax=uncultured Draconibacterium sp. TaxID=1573823 RepID=UPI0025F8891C|nr:DUF4373 domain-containing protein [uncultured Draconibacterium sp.]